MMIIMSIHAKKSMRLEDIGTLKHFLKAWAFDNCLFYILVDFELWEDFWIWKSSTDLSNKISCLKISTYVFRQINDKKVSSRWNQPEARFEAVLLWATFYQNGPKYAISLVNILFSILLSMRKWYLIGHLWSHIVSTKISLQIGQEKWCVDELVMKSMIVGFGQRRSIVSPPFWHFWDAPTWKFCLIINCFETCSTQKLTKFLWIFKLALICLHFYLLF